MRSETSAFLALALLGAGCGSPGKPPAVEASRKAAAVKPFDESHRFPRQDQLRMELLDEKMLGKEFLPGGNLATYEKGKLRYQMFLVKSSGPEAAALLLFEYKGRLEKPKLIPHFGGYFGIDGGKPAFIFPKKSYLAGILGLPEPDADRLARSFAARID